MECLGVVVARRRMADDATVRLERYSYMYRNTCRVSSMARRHVSDEDREVGRRLGAALRNARNVAGMSAQTIASLSDLSIDTVRSIETGRTASPSFITVSKIADALGISLDELRDAAPSEDAR
ncbi:helix-turn-helix domain-containing protein [Microbacterium aurugineum]|uniref:helix-turn-helix domain-containing protein n=1 Tax=Microbacterium aurugineum TaxID=2851642 RepID=UPI0027DFC40A|nr:helix-turn-helix domain-containing protein [Microbacterium aurugineum]